MSKFFELFSKNVRSVLAIMITSCGFAFLFVLMRLEIPKANESIINISAGLILGTMSGVAGYYFGASKDKSDREKADIVKEGGDPNKMGP